MLVQTYLARASDFLRGANLADGDSTYSYSSALLAIHCAISYSDALRYGLQKTNLAADDHENAVDDVQKLLRRESYAYTEGLKHLRELLRNKSFCVIWRQSDDPGSIESDCRTRTAICELGD